MTLSSSDSVVVHKILSSVGGGDTVGFERAA